MPENYRIASIDYTVSDPTLSAVEQHRQRALAAIQHLSGLGKLLQSIDVESMSAPSQIQKHRLANLIDGANTVGELVAILSDAAYGSVCEMSGFIPVRPYVSDSAPTVPEL